MSRKTITTRDFQPETGSHQLATLVAIDEITKRLKRLHHNDEAFFANVAEALVMLAAEATTGEDIEFLPAEFMGCLVADVTARIG